MNLEYFNKQLDDLNLSKPFSLLRSEKDRFLAKFIGELTHFHREQCEGYSAFCDLKPISSSAESSIENFPMLPVRMFKQHELFSVPRENIFKTLTSSGTSGQSVSRIYLDANTAKRQSQILSSITKDFIGESRVPMVIVDSRELITDRTKLNARAAGILGYSLFGRNHFYCLDKNLNLRVDELMAFLQEHNSGPILIFGFTYIVWQYLALAAKNMNIELNFGAQSMLIHGGGWKKLESEKVDNIKFKSELLRLLNIGRVHNYYGMVEQVGSVFMECEEGHLHCPDFADIIVRNPLTLEVAPIGAEGVVQVLSILPISYPGQSLLTEDLGTVLGVDDCPCGRSGKYFRVSGRMPMAELRGCSDVRAAML